MSLQKRQSSPPEQQDDLEVTAELPVLDVAAYEAGAASVATTGSQPSIAAPERDPLNNTDTWHIPAHSLRMTTGPDVASPVIDENRAKLEANLHSLATTLRDVEDRLTRKSERLAEMEKQLELAVGERNTTEHRARGLTADLPKAEAASTAAQARIAELQKALADNQAADAARRARDAEIQAQLNERNRQIQAQLTSAAREFEAKLAASNHDFQARFASHALVLVVFVLVLFVVCVWF